MESGKLPVEKRLQEVSLVKGTSSLNKINQNTDKEQNIKPATSRSLCNFQEKPTEMILESNPVQLESILENNETLKSKVNNNDEIVSRAGVPIGVIKEDSESQFAEQEAFVVGPENLEVIEKGFSKAGSEASTDIICRICHDNPLDMPLIQPCSCKGSMGLVHQDCLEHWLGESGKTSCEICGFEYILNRKPKYTGIRSVYAWMRNPTSPSDTKNLFFDLACFFVLTPLATISAWLCILGSQHYSTTPQPDSPIEHRYGDRIDEGSNSRWTSIGLLTLTVTLLSAYYIWLFIAFKYHYNIWKIWQERNYIVEFLPIPFDETDSTDKTEAVDDLSISITTPMIQAHSETSSAYTLSSIVIQIQPDPDHNETGIMDTSTDSKE